MDLADPDIICVDQDDVSIWWRIHSIGSFVHQDLSSWCEEARLVLAVAYSGEVECLEDVSSKAQMPLLPTSVSFIEF